MENQKDGLPPADVFRKILQSGMKVASNFLMHQTEARQVVMLKFVSHPEEITMKSGLCFKPEYLHQLFGEQEVIRGYKDLKIEIYFASGSLNCYVYSEYSEKQEGADDYMHILEHWLIGGFTTNLKEFTQILDQQKDWLPPGHRLETKYPQEIYFMDPQTQDFEEHRMKVWPLLLFFIETASYDDKTPDYWRIYTMYQFNGRSFEFVGFLSKTVFSYNVLKARHRISQVLIAPPFQRQGFGIRLLDVVYEDMLKDDNCVQITIEESSDDFQVIRDILDCRMLLQANHFDWFKATPPRSLDNILEIEKLNLPKAELFKIARKFKLTLAQSRRVFEILLLSRVKMEDKFASDRYKQLIVQRMRDEDDPIKNMRKVPYLIFEGAKEVLDVQIITELQNKIYLAENFYDNAYEELLEHYALILKKLQI